MSVSAGLIAYRLSFQTCPIILTGGVAQFLGGMLPIIAITESLNFASTLFGDSNFSTDATFATFQPLGGGSLIDNQYGKYPFANQTVAANAQIAQPLRIDILMTCPANASRGGFGAKLAILTALQATLATHTNSGGTFTVATPSYIYTNCLLDSLTDATPNSAQQPQSLWKFSFEQPLLTEAQAFQAEGAQMQKLTGGLPTTGATSGVQVIAQPLSLASSAFVQGAGNLTGTNTASYIPQ